MWCVRSFKFEWCERGVSGNFIGFESNIEGVMNIHHEKGKEKDGCGGQCRGDLFRQLVRNLLLITRKTRCVLGRNFIL